MTEQQSDEDRADDLIKTIEGAIAKLESMNDDEKKELYEKLPRRRGIKLRLEHNLIINPEELEGIISSVPHLAALDNDEFEWDLLRYPEVVHNLITHAALFAEERGGSRIQVRAESFIDRDAALSAVMGQPVTIEATDSATGQVQSEVIGADAGKPLPGELEDGTM